MIKMPQITCPNCGLTINLENRRRIDFEKILKEVEKPKTFTELLKATHLPRKTLSLRLKELCEKGVLVKENGIYKRMENAPKWETRRFSVRKLSVLHGERIRSTAMLVFLLVCFSVSGYVFGRFLVLPTSVNNDVKPDKTILGIFTLNVMIHNVTDLYAWQVAIRYAPSELKVLKITPGGFVGSEFPCFVSSCDTSNDLILVGGSLLGNVSGRSGSGKLATILFGYFTKDYQEPKITFDGPFATRLFNSNGGLIEIKEGMLSLETG